MNKTILGIIDIRIKKFFAVDKTQKYRYISIQDNKAFKQDSKASEIVYLFCFIDGSSRFDSYSISNGLGL